MRSESRTKAVGGIEGQSLDDAATEELISDALEPKPSGGSGKEWSFTKEDDERFVEAQVARRNL